MRVAGEGNSLQFNPSSSVLDLLGELSVMLQVLLAVVVLVDAREHRPSDDGCPNFDLATPPLGA